MKVCILGDAMLDVYRHITPTKLSQEAPVVVGLHSHDQYVPGGAANSAANCVALGAEAALVGYVGTDIPAQWLAKTLQAAGVEDQCIVLDAWTTICKERIVDVSTGHQFVRIDTEAHDPATKKCESSVILDRLKELIDTCDCLLVSDYDKGTVRWVVEEAISLFRARGKFVVVNGKPGHLRHYIQADVVTMNRAEWDMACHGSSDAKSVQIFAQRHIPGTTIVITRGAQPLVVMRPGAEPEYYAPHKVDVADVSGAGDTLAAVLAVRGNVFQRTVEEAVEIATEVVQYKGTAVPKTRLLTQ